MDSKIMTVEDFEAFKAEVQAKNRTFLSTASMAFMDWLGDIADEIMEEIPEGQIFFRARVWKDGNPLSKPEDMKPVPQFSSDGRANPYGINMLYLADHPEIALAEVRPNNKDQITVAQFHSTRDLKIVDFSKVRMNLWHYRMYDLKSDPDSYYKKDILIAIGSAFSVPISVRDSRKEYLPTQIIAEYFKSKGFDGVAYQSQFLPNPEGEPEQRVYKNYTLFDLDAADPISFEVYEIKQQFLQFQVNQESEKYEVVS